MMINLREAGQVAREQLFPALSHRDFRLMWLGQVAAESASWALMTAEAWLTFTLAEENRNSWVGAVMLAAMLPWFVVPVVVGFLTDRFVRRNILALAYAISLVHSLVLAVLVFTDAIQVWHVTLLAFVNGVATATRMGSIESLGANLVPARDLPNAYTLINAAYYATRLIGPGVIAPLLGVIHLGWIFVICMTLYMAGSYLTLRIQTASSGVVERTRGLLYNAFSGFGYVYKHKILRSIIFLTVFHCSLVMSFESLLPAISQGRLGFGGEGVAYLNMMVGLGALLLSIGIAPLHGESLRGRLFLATGVVSAAGDIVLGIASSLPVAMLGAVVMGIAHTGFMTIATIMIQSVTPDGLRGRVTSIYLIHAGGIMAFSYFANGVLADHFNPSWIVAVGSIAFVGVMSTSLLTSTPRRLYLAGVPVQARAIAD